MVVRRIMVVIMIAIMVVAYSAADETTDTREVGHVACAHALLHDVV